MPSLTRVVRRVRRAVAPQRAERIRGGVGDGLRIHLAYASADYTDGANERPVQDAVASLLAPGGTFFDVGANVGFFSLVAARVVGASGHVYAFEPVPHIAECIRANARRNELANIDVLEVAVVDRGGRAPLLLSAHPGGATLSDRDTPADLTGTIEVETVAIDDLVAAGTVQPPTVVKVDVEGVELEVLQGMDNTLRTHQPAIVCELDAATEDEVRAKLEPVSAFFGERSYRIEHLPRSYTGMGWQVLHLVARPSS